MAGGDALRTATGVSPELCDNADETSHWVMVAIVWCCWSGIVSPEPSSKVSLPALPQGKPALRTFRLNPSMRAFRVISITSRAPKT